MSDLRWYTPHVSEGISSCSKRVLSAFEYQVVSDFFATSPSSCAQSLLVILIYLILFHFWSSIHHGQEDCYWHRSWNHLQSLGCSLCGNCSVKLSAVSSFWTCFLSFDQCQQPFMTLWPLWFVKKERLMTRSNSGFIGMLKIIMTLGPYEPLN